MKSIKTSVKKVPGTVYLFGLAFFVLAVIAFVLTVNFAGENKQEYPTLTLNLNLQKPDSSTDSVFYSNAFTLSLSASGAHKIYYTLDGTPPSLTATVYTKPIVVAPDNEAAATLAYIPTSTRWQPPLGDVYKAITLRAICVDEQNNKSEELVQTFISNRGVIKRYQLPVIALTINPDDFFGYENGIYVMGKKYEDKDYYIRKNLRLDMPWWKYPSNYMKRGDNAERPVHVLYQENGKGFEMNAGVRINGNATRGFSQKSLRICFDNKYGPSELSYSMFPETSLNKFKTLVLRNSGNDWEKTMFRNAFMQSLMQGSHLDLQSEKPCIVLINGEYWGIHGICTRFDEEYVAEKYHFSADSIAMMEVNGGQLVANSKREKKEFEQLIRFIASTDLHVQKNYDAVASQMDIPSFMDMIIANVYFANGDWPENNVKFWRFKTTPTGADSLGLKDGRWRWMLYDTDWGFGFTGKAAVASNLLEKVKKMSYIGVIFDKLLTNEKFAIEFVNRFNYHLNNTFEAKRVIQKIDSFQSVYGPEMQAHINRWRIIGTYKNWLRNVEELRTFAAKRPEIQREQLDVFIDKNKKE